MSRNKIINRIKKNMPFSDKSCLKGISLTRRGILFPLSAPVITIFLQILNFKCKGLVNKDYSKNKPMIFSYKS